MRRRGLLRLGAGALALSALSGGSGQAANRRGAGLGNERIVVVGGGISGLSAAWLLGDRSVRVLEAASLPGGRTRSGRWRGWHYAQGTEYLGPPEGTLKRMIAELGLRPVEVPEPMDEHLDQGRFYAGPGARTRLLAGRGGVEAYNRFLRVVQGAMDSYDDVPDHDESGPLARLDRMTARAWLDELGLPPVFHRRFGVAARGLFAANIDEISALCLLPEIAFDFEDCEPVESPTDDDGEEDEGSGAFTFAEGIAEVPSALAEALGDRVVFGARVTGVTGSDRDGYVVTWTDPAGRTLREEAGAVILAVPAPIALGLGGAALNPVQRDVLTRIPFGTYATVVLFADDPIYSRAFDLAVEEGMAFTDLYDATWVQRAVERVADPTAAERSGHIVSAHVAPSGHRDKGPMLWSDREVVERTLRDLDRVFPRASERVVGWDVQRHPHAYPVMTPGAFGRLTRLHRAAGGGLQLAGDGVIYPTFEAAVEAGALAARRVRAFLD